MTKGIVIVGYGTRKGNLEQILDAQAARLRAMGRKNVYVAYFRVSKPSIPEVLERMAADGIDKVLAIPYYVAEGRLTSELIPEAFGISGRFGNTEVKGKQMYVRIAPAFGTKSALADILCDRIAEAKGTMDSGILIVGHGSRDPGNSNHEIVELNAGRLRDRGYSHVGYAFNEMCEPTLDSAVTELIDAGVKEIIVVPLFIAMGLHLGEEVPEQIGIPPYSPEGIATRNGKSVPVRYMRPLGDDVRLLEIINRKVADFYGE